MLRLMLLSVLLALSGCDASGVNIKEKHPGFPWQYSVSQIGGGDGLLYASEDAEQMWEIVSGIASQSNGAIRGEQAYEIMAEANKINERTARFFLFNRNIKYDFDHEIGHFDSDKEFMCLLKQPLETKLAKARPENITYKM